MLNYSVAELRFTNFAVGKTKYAEFVDTKMYVYKA